MMFLAGFLTGISATFFIEFVSLVAIAIGRKKGGDK